MLNIHANWPAPGHLKTLVTTRPSGFSQAPYACNNLALHVGDDPSAVLANRRQLVESYHLPSEPAWLEQTHSNHCVVIEDTDVRHADAAITRQPNQVLAIMTADCVPILVCNRQGSEIAAIHAGWRGLVNGVVSNTLAQLNSAPEDLMAWIGPSICAACYEVGDEVRNTILGQYQFAEHAFQASAAHTPEQPKWLANLPLIAEMLLKTANIAAVYQSNLCTFEQKEYFYSYRRESQTGRIATLIWLT